MYVCRNPRTYMISNGHSIIYQKWGCFCKNFNYQFCIVFFCSLFLISGAHFIFKDLFKFVNCLNTNTKYLCPIGCLNILITKKNVMNETIIINKILQIDTWLVILYSEK